ncbi:hypothetical protein [Streptomyces sp. NBC_00691]|uniref:hypothetical protein n=1 Tax=Streptomyces sp. NBC_00691 TaxID=2903671 RepID=UPI002E3132D4|nr:hypothetical protein [Streptomyces sp. NBC_00691]
MPPRSKDINALRRFAHQHVHAHARSATPRPHAACACGAAECRHHTTRTTCTGRILLILVHNRAVGDVWTLTEVCQACAPHIVNATVLPGAATPPGGSVPAPAKTAPPAAVQATFSSPQPTDADDVSAARRSQRPPRARRGGGPVHRRGR